MTGQGAVCLLTRGDFTLSLLSPTNDTFEGVRRVIIPKLGMLVQAYNEATGSSLYVKGDSGKKEFVGRVQVPEETFEKRLKEIGFKRNPLASLKNIIGTKEKEEGSFRMLGTQFDNYRDDFQLHVILYDGKLVPNANSGETYIFAHWEYRWDTNPMKHYKGVNISMGKGVDMMRDLLEQHDVTYDQHYPVTKE